MLTKVCQLCDGDHHISSSYNKITTVDERKEVLKERNYATTVRENITVLLNGEVKDLAITAINVTTRQFAAKKGGRANLNLIRRK